MWGKSKKKVAEKPPSFEGSWRTPEFKASFDFQMLENNKCKLQAGEDSCFMRIISFNGQEYEEGALPRRTWRFRHQGSHLVGIRKTDGQKEWSKEHIFTEVHTDVEVFSGTWSTPEYRSAFVFDKLPGGSCQLTAAGDAAVMTRCHESGNEWGVVHFPGRSWRFHHRGSHVVGNRKKDGDKNWSDDHIFSEGLPGQVAANTSAQPAKKKIDSASCFAFMQAARKATPKNKVPVPAIPNGSREVNVEVPGSVTFARALTHEDNRDVAKVFVSFAVALAVIPIMGLVLCERFLRATVENESTRWMYGGAFAVMLVNMVLMSYVLYCYYIEGFPQANSSSSPPSIQDLAAAGVQSKTNSKKRQ